MTGGASCSEVGVFLLLTYGRDGGAWADLEGIACVAHGVGELMPSRHNQGFLVLRADGSEVLHSPGYP